MVSVIIPTYNRLQLLKQALDSVHNQTEPCSEVIVVDDGSTDGTQRFIETYRSTAGTQVRYFYQDNRGAPAARNLGIREAAGDILCFLDSDDLFQPEKIEVQKRALIESCLLVSHTGEKWLRRGNHLNKKKKHHPPDGYIFPRCLPMCVVGMSTVMAHRELFERYGLFDESLPCCEDYDLWLRTSCREQFNLVPRQLTVKNGGRADQLSVIYRVGMDKYRIMALEKLLKSGELTDEQYRLAAKEFERKCIIYGNGCIKHGRPEEGEKFLRLPSQYKDHIS